VVPVVGVNVRRVAGKTGVTVRVDEKRAVSATFRAFIEGGSPPIRSDYDWYLPVRGHRGTTAGRMDARVPTEWHGVGCERQRSSPPRPGRELPDVTKALADPGTVHRPVRPICRLPALSLDPPIGGLAAS
jgi:hypothetical protein